MGGRRCQLYKWNNKKCHKKSICLFKITIEDENDEKIFKVFKARLCRTHINKIAFGGLKVLKKDH